MAIAFVQSANTGAVTTNFSLAYSSPNTQGNTLIAVTRFSNPASGKKIPVISDTQNNTGWFLLAQNYSAIDRESLLIWCCPSCKGGANTVTAGPTVGASFNIMVILEYSGVTFGTSPCSVSLSPPMNALGTTFNSGTVKPNLATNLIIGAITNGTAFNVTYTAPGFTQRDSAGGDTTVFDIIQSSPTQQTFSGTSNSSVRMMAAVATVDGSDPNTKIIACDGDSITYGNGILYPWPSSLSLNLTVPTADVFNFGIPSETLATMVTNAPTNIDPLLVVGKQNICVIFGGTNDFAVTGRTPAQVFSSLQTYCAARRAAGWKVVVVTMISRAGNNPVGGETVDADKNAYNALIRAAGSSLYDGLADVAGNANLGADGAFANLTYFQADQTHPTQLSATTIIAPIVGAAINGVLFAYSVPDCRSAKPSSATSRAIQGTLIYDVQTSSNHAIPPTDSRTAGAPVDSRVAANVPQNSRTPGTYGPGVN